MEENINLLTQNNCTNTISDSESITFPFMLENIKRKKSRLGTHRKSEKIPQFRSANDNEHKENISNDINYENISNKENISNNINYENILSNINHENILNNINHENILNHVNHENILNNVSQDNILNNINHETISSNIKHENISNNINHETISNNIKHENISNNINHENILNRLNPENISNNVNHENISHHVNKNISNNVLKVFENVSTLKNCVIEENKNAFNFAQPSTILNKNNTIKTPAFIIVKGKSYKVEKILGKGASCVVYEVQDLETNDSLAIKRVKLSRVEDIIAEGYLQEVEMLEKLQNCDAIIKMYDHEVSYENNKKILSVVMEKGDRDFASLIRKFNSTEKLSIFQLLSYWEGMLVAVNEIHKKGIIHSDLKPANFLLVEGKLKLIDFGIASSIQGDMTSVYKDILSGTYNYMSPEAVHYVNNSTGPTGYKITYKTDIWSLGCILYNLIYGKLPFSHIKLNNQKIFALMNPNITVEFPEVKDIPPSLLEVCKSCLNKDLQKRPSASELLTQLQLFKSRVLMI